MTQPQTPGQPYVPPSAPFPAASSAPSYASQQYSAGQAQYPQQAQYAAPGQYMQQPGAQAPGQDSFFSRLLTPAKGFVDSYGTVVMILAIAAFVLSWLYASWETGSLYTGYGDIEFNGVRFAVDLLLTAPWCIVKISLVRLLIELVRNTAPRSAADASSRA